MEDMLKRLLSKGFNVRFDMYGECITAIIGWQDAVIVTAQGIVPGDALEAAYKQTPAGIIVNAAYHAHGAERLQRMLAEGEL